MIVDQVETDADLGYIKMFATEIHNYIVSDAFLSERTSLLIKEAHDKMIEAYGSIVQGLKKGLVSPDKAKKT